MSTERILDRVQRLQALDPTQSFIVQAPAGSGKTELLIQRFLTLLARVEHPESIIAVTFTRKAAGEMRHRVVDALQKASRNVQPEKEHERHTWELCRAVLAQDEKQGWQLIQHPSRLRIQTIDSLCGMLVRQMPWLSRMGASAPPEENAEYLYREAARLTIEMLSGRDLRAVAIERLLKHLDNNVDKIESLLTGMLRSRDHWMRHVVRNMRSADLRPKLQSAMRQIIADELEVVRDLFPVDILAETIPLADFAARNLAMENPGSDLAQCAGMHDLPGAAYADIRQWCGLAELFLTKSGDRRKRLDKNTGFPAKPDCKAEKAQCLALELPPDFIRALHGVRLLPPDQFSESQWDVLSALTELLPVAVAQLKIVFQREGKVDFTEIAHASGAALGTPDSPTDLAFSLDCRIEHLLVDEFQDTSYGQFELLEKLTAEWTPGDGRTLFLVGDPMQSIYGFREAEVALFLKARDKGVGNVLLQSLKLSVNFRSSAGVVNWVNDALGSAFPTAPDMFRGAVPFEPSVAFEAGDGTPAIHVHPSLGNDPETEAETVVDIVRKSRVENPAATVAVLVRSRSHLFAIVNALRRAREKFMAVEIDRLGDRSVVQDLLALTAALLHFGDRAAWLSILRAPWCGLTLADLQALVGSEFTSAIWDLLNDEPRLETISPDGRARIDRVKPILREAIAERGRLPLRRWVEGLWMALGGPACLDDETGLEDAAVFFDLLEESASGATLRDQGRFMEDVAGLFARPDVHADGRLQLLTVHKAKGLEFDTVILPGLGRSPRGDDPRLLLWLEYIDRNEQSQLLLAPIKETGTEDDPAYAYVQKIKSEKTANETTRLLYVAATRAKSHLHLLGHAERDSDTGDIKPPASRTLLSRIWNSVSPEFEVLPRNPEQREPLPDSAARAGIPLRRLSTDWRAIAAPADVAWRSADISSTSEEETVREHVTFEWATELQRRVGIVVHAMLQQVDVSAELAWNVSAISTALAVQGLTGDRLREAIARVERALRATVTDERGRWILATHAEDQREYAVCGRIGNRVRHFTIDRTFVDDSGTRWIIDYKTGSHEGGSLDGFLDNEQARYRPQLEPYAQLMSQLDSRPIHMGLYFPMLQAWREWAR